MGKGEELHMELEFDRDVIHCWEIAADGTLCQEETLETIVPDAWSGHPPHRGGMRTGDTEREAGPGGGGGGERKRPGRPPLPAGGGGRLRRMEAALPFSAQMEAPGLTEQGPGPRLRPSPWGGGPGSESPEGAAPGRPGGGCDRPPAQGAGVLPGGAGP